MIFRPPKEKKKPAPVIEAVPEENQEDVQDNNEIDTPVISTFRPKNETPEERKARKQAIKQFQRDHREAKSSEKKAQKEAINKAKMVNAINKRQNYGDVPSGVCRFAI
jgi:protein LTV1